MARLNVELLVVTFSVLPLMIIVTLTFRTKVRSAFRDVRTSLARIGQKLTDQRVVFYGAGASGAGGTKMACTSSIAAPTTRNAD